MIDFKEIESQFYRLRGKLKVGVISEEQFRTEVAKLMVQDESGTYWTIEPETGQWLCYTGHHWLPGDPYRKAGAPPPTMPELILPPKRAEVPPPTTPEPILPPKKVPPPTAIPEPILPSKRIALPPKPPTPLPQAAPVQPKGRAPWLPLACGCGALLLLLCMLGGGGLWLWQSRIIGLPPTATLTPTVGQLVISDLIPDNGARITGRNLTITWRTVPQSQGWAYYRPKGRGDFQRIDGGAGERHQATLPDLKSGQEYEFYVEAVLRDTKSQSEVRTLLPVKGIVFTEDVYSFEVKRDYNQWAVVEVVNEDEQPHRLLLLPEARFDDLVVGFMGKGSMDEMFDLAPGQRKSVRFVIMAADALQKEYRFPITLYNMDGKESIEDTKGAALDRAEVRLGVKFPAFDLQITKVREDLTTLAQRYRIKNLGDTISDLSVVAKGDLRYQVSFSPRIEHVALGLGEEIEFEALPLLFVGFRNVSGKIAVQGAGQEKEVDVAFVLPEGKSVYLGFSRSTEEARTEGSTCTNKGYVRLGIGEPDVIWSEVLLCGSPIRWNVLVLHEDESYSCPGMETLEECEALFKRVWEFHRRRPMQPGLDKSATFVSYCQVETSTSRTDAPQEGGKWLDVIRTWLGKLWLFGGNIVREPPPPPSGNDGPGIRGDGIRENVAKYYPNLEEDSFLSPFTVLTPDYLYLTWHSDALRGRRAVVLLGLKLDGTEPALLQTLNSPQSEARWPILAADGQGNVYAAWEGSTAGKPEIIFRRSGDSGKTWGPEKSLTSHGKGAYDPVIAASRKRVFVVWEDHRHGQPEIYLRVSEDVGETFGPEIRVTTDLQGSRWPWIALDRAGALHIVHEKSDGGVSQVYYLASKDGGKTFSQPFRLSSPGVDSGEPRLLVDSHGKLHVVYRVGDGNKSEVFYRRSEDGGSNWLPPLQVTNDNFYSEYPQIGEVADGRLWLKYHSNDLEIIDAAYLLHSSAGGNT